MSLVDPPGGKCARIGAEDESHSTALGKAQSRSCLRPLPRVRDLDPPDAIACRQPDDREAVAVMSIFRPHYRKKILLITGFAW